MAKLVETSRTGDAVHEALEMSASSGFRCVARGWYNQTQPLGDGIDQLTNDARKREDILCPMKHMGLGLDSAGEYVLEYVDGREFKPTEHAFKQLATWCYVPHTFLNYYTRNVTKQNGETLFTRDSQDKETLIRVFQNGKRRVEPDKNFRFRTYTDGTLRAVLSERYATINNIWYLETLAELFKSIGGDEPRISHWRGNADTIYGNILIPDTCREENDSDYGGMISVSNCEIGIRRLSQFPSIFRAICMNGCIWDQNSGEKIDKVHRGDIDLNDLRERIAKNIHDQIPLLAKGVDKFLALRSYEVEKNVKLSNIFAMVAMENGFSLGQNGQLAKIVTKFQNHESNNRNLFGIVNSITRTGQEYDNAEWVRFDMVAGQLTNYTEQQWKALQSRANVMEEKAFNKAYGIAV